MSKKSKALQDELKVGLNRSSVDSKTTDSSRAVLLRTGHWLLDGDASYLQCLAPADFNAEVRRFIAYSRMQEARDEIAKGMNIKKRTMKIAVTWTGATIVMTLLGPLGKASKCLMDGLRALACNIEDDWFELEQNGPTLWQADTSGAPTGPCYCLYSVARPDRVVATRASLSGA